MKRWWCNWRGHKWAYTADVCDRCGMTGTEFHAVRPTAPDDPVVNAAYWRGFDDSTRMRDDVPAMVAAKLLVIQEKLEAIK